MKKSILSTILSAALLLPASCVKDAQTPKNDAAQRYFEAWISYYYPDAQKTPLGAYILEDTPGTGLSSADSLYVRADYSYYDLDGNLIGTTRPRVAKQNGTFKSSNYYGPAFFYRGEELDNLPAGVEEAFASMRVGGKRRVVIPGWLGEYSKRYDSEENYLLHCSGTDYIYELELVSALDNTEKWEKDSLARFISANCPEAVESESMPGFYYLTLRKGLEDKTYTKDSTIYMNYTGRTLDGRVFDTTVADTAKVWNIYSSSKTYEPVLVNWDDDDYSGITITSNKTSVISGFSYGISLLHPREKAQFFFYSGYGYSNSGSGSTIPAFCPLIFEVDIVDEL